MNKRKQNKSFNLWFLIGIVRHLLRNAFPRAPQINLSQESIKTGHELTQANTRRILSLGIVLVMSASTLIFVIKIFFVSLLKYDPQNALLRANPPEPHLQSNPREDLKIYLERENHLLSTYGWIDEKAKISHVPIQRAMDILSKKTQDSQDSKVRVKKAKDLNGVNFEQNIGTQIPLNTQLTNEHGLTQPIGSYFVNSPVILVFTYYRCPRLCSLVLNGLVDGLKALPDLLGKDYQVLSVSIDPKEKPPLALAKKRSYLARLGLSERSVEENFPFQSEVEYRVGSQANQPENRGARQGGDSWHFLTGEESQIQILAGQAGFHYFKDPESGDYAHPSGIILLSPTGKISQYLLGIQFDPRKLHQALLTAKSEQVGTWADQILLKCFHYDPKLSQNGPLIMSAIRSSSLLGTFILTILLIYLYLKDRKNRAT